MTCPLDIFLREMSLRPSTGLSVCSMPPVTHSGRMSRLLLSPLYTSFNKYMPFICAFKSHENRNDIDHQTDFFDALVPANFSKTKNMGQPNLRKRLHPSG